MTNAREVGHSVMEEPAVYVCHRTQEGPRGSSHVSAELGSDENWPVTVPHSAAWLPIFWEDYREIQAGVRLR